MQELLLDLDLEALIIRGVPIASLLGFSTGDVPHGIPALGPGSYKKIINVTSNSEPMIHVFH